jgi:hypothetical protein
MFEEDLPHHFGWGSLFFKRVPLVGVMLEKVSRSAISRWKVPNHFLSRNFTLFGTRFSALNPKIQDQSYENVPTLNIIYSKTTATYISQIFQCCLRFLQRQSFCYPLTNFLGWQPVERPALSL